MDPENKSLLKALRTRFLDDSSTESEEGAAPDFDKIDAALSSQHKPTQILVRKLLRKYFHVRAAPKVEVSESDLGVTNQTVECSVVTSSPFDLVQAKERPRSFNLLCRIKNA